MIIPTSLLGQIRPYTMVQTKCLNRLYDAAMSAPTGDFVECGVCRGGIVAMLGTIAKMRNKTVHGFDTFTGLPSPGLLDIYNGGRSAIADHMEGAHAAPIEVAKEICAILQCSDSVRLYKGFFADTLPEFAKRGIVISVLHCDADLYTSTRDIFHNLFDLVISGGHIQIDDYSDWEGCKKATDDFLSDRCPTAKIVDGLWFTKP